MAEAIKKLDRHAENRVFGPGVKLRFLAALFLLSVVASAQAQSSHKGRYFGVFYEGGKPVSGANITISDTGELKGRGAITTLRQVQLSGVVNSDETVSVTAKGNEHEVSFLAKFTASGKKFSGRAPGGQIFKGKKLKPHVTQTGIYSVTTDIGERGLIMVDRNNRVFGVIYHQPGKPIDIRGKADTAQFGGIGEDGVFFFGDFDGLSISGTYTDSSNFHGTFYGKKFVSKK